MKKFLVLAVLFFLLCQLIACGPKVIAFHATPTMIGRGDSVNFVWKVRGRPTLQFYVEDAGDDENADKQYYNYRLVAQKCGKTAFDPITITLLGDSANDDVVINTQRKGDSAVASGGRDIHQWGTHFLLVTISSASHRPLNVTHGGRTIVLDGGGLPSAAFVGLPNSGPWRIGTLLTPAELRDTTLIPGRLALRTTLFHHS